MDKTTLLDNISAGHEMLAKALSPLNRTQMTTAGVIGDWSIKDILVHIVSWQQLLLAQMGKDARGDKSDTYGMNINEEEMDRLNERFYRENKNRPLDEVLNDFQSTHTTMLAAVEAMTDEDLTDPHRFAWTNGKPLWQFIASETYEHTLEHIGAIRRWR